MDIAPHDHLVNPHLIRMARDSMSRIKEAFIPAGDPSQGGGAPPPGGGGAPPPGGDPSGGMGGAPPMDPSAGGGGGGGTSHMELILQKLNQMAAQGGGGGGAGGAPGSGAAIKPKIDVNVELMQIKNMLAKICDHLQIHIPAQDMTATPDKLMAMSQGQPTSAPQPGGGGGGGGAIGGIDPMSGMQPAGAPGGAQKMGHAHNNGIAFDTGRFADIADFATALGTVIGQR